MWERFSYYGMRALLILYLVNSLEFPRDKALEIYATYTALVYLTPIIGGYLADKWLGTQRAVLIGGIVMALGHFAMAFSSLLYLGLGLLIVGNGLFKPNISTMVGSLYHRDDSRRDGGFTIFYMGINVGAFLAPLICGTLGEKLGWHYGFAAAGVGMILGIIIFTRGQNRLSLSISTNNHAQPQHGIITANDWYVVIRTSLLVLLFVIAMLAAVNIIDPIWKSLSPFHKTVMVLFIIILSLLILPLLGKLRKKNTPDQPLTRVERHRIIAIFIMGVFVVFFWMGFEQAGGTMTLFANQQTDRYLFAWEVPVSYFQSINPLLIILLGPVFSLLWTRLEHSRFALSSIAKQGIGMIILGFGFIVLAIAQAQAEIIGKVGPIWLVAVYTLHTIGELCLAPIGLSMVTKLSPARVASLMMGIWFTAIAIASYLAGMLESFLSVSNVPLYWFLVGSSIGAGVVLLMITPLIRKLMHGAA